jgi:DNA polymerase III alpha subunit (gram-positive type)
VWPKAALEFAKCKVLIAHNAPFDRDMLQLELRRIGVVLQTPFICTIGLFREQFGYDMKLPQLYEHATGKRLSQIHRAGSDVDALVEIVQALELWK